MTNSGYLVAGLIGLGLCSCSAALPGPERIASATQPELALLEDDLRERLDPVDRDTDTLHALARIMAAQGKREQAETLAVEATNLEPFHSGFLETLAEILLQQEKRFQALLAYNQAVTVDSERLSAYVGLAITHQLLGDSASARKALEQAIRFEPRYFDARFHLARILFEIGETIPAEPAIVATRRIRPADKEALLLHLRILIALERLEDALLLAQERLAVNPDDLEILRQLLDIHVQREDWDSAETIYQRLAALGEPTPDDILAGVKIAAARGRIDSAGQQLDRLLEQFPRHAPALVVLSQSLLARNRPAEAIRPLTAAVEVAPNWPEGHYWMAVAYFSLGDFLRGNLALKRADSLSPHHKRTRLLRIRRLLAEGAEAQASGLLDTYLKSQPGDVEALMLRAEWQTLTGDYDGAEKTLSTMPPGDPAARFARGRLAFLRRQYHAAIDHTSPLVDQATPAWEAVYLHAAALGSLRRYDEALAAISPFMKTDFGAGAFHRLAGYLHERSGNRKAARKAFARGLRSHPRDPWLIDGASRIAIDTGEWVRAQGLLEAGIEQNSPLLPVFLERLATVYRTLELPEKEREIRRRFLAVIDPLPREAGQRAQDSVLFRMRLPPIELAVEPPSADSGSVPAR